MRHVAIFAVLLAALSGPALAQRAPEGGDLVMGSDRDRVVITGMVPIPDVGEGAPRFSSADVEVIEKEARDMMTKAGSDIRRCDVARFSAPCDPTGGKGLPACSLAKRSTR